MNLRLPIVTAVVAAAAGAAAVRAFAPAPSVPSLSVAASTSEVPTPQTQRHHPSNFERATKIVVYVAGEVRRSGIYELPPSARALDALRAAGGSTPNADLVAVDLAQSLSDGDEVAVPARDSAAAAHAPARSHRSHGHHKKKRHHKKVRTSADFSDSSDGPKSVVNLNLAGESELETLPGVGAALAERIVAFRERAGPYSTPDDLLDVAGMTQGKLDAIEPYVTVSN